MSKILMNGGGHSSGFRGFVGESQDKQLQVVGELIDRLQKQLDLARLATSGEELSKISKRIDYDLAVFKLAIKDVG